MLSRADAGGFWFGGLGSVRCASEAPLNSYDLNSMFSRLASQTVVQDALVPLILNVDGTQIFRTAILGMSVEISTGGNTESILIAEQALGSLEVFFATAIEQRLLPHTERLTLNVVESTEVTEPTFDINDLSMTGTIHWPSELSPKSFEHQKEIHQFWIMFSGQMLSLCWGIKDAEGLVEKLCTDEAVLHRLTMVIVASTSFQRLTSGDISRLSDWQEAVKERYCVRPSRPRLAQVILDEEPESIEEQSADPSLPSDHRAYSAKSIIDIHAWNKARWKGVGYLQIDPFQPPCMAFLFEDEEGGNSIFSRWRERFGATDFNEEIYISIIRKIPGESEHFYYVMVTAKLPNSEVRKPRKVLTITHKSPTPCVVAPPWP